MVRWRHREEVAHWLIATRALFLSLALAVVSAHTYLYRDGILTDADFDFLYKPIALLFGWCALSGMWVTWGRARRFFLTTQVLSDIAIVTASVYVSGGPLSPLLFLFLLHTMEIALLFGRNAAFVVAAVHTLLLAALDYALMSGMVSTIEGVMMREIPQGTAPLQVLGVASGMVLVAVATSFLTSRLTQTRLLVETTSKQVADLKQQHYAVIEGIPDAVIFVDPSYRATLWNGQALSLLQTSREELSGASLPEIVQRFMPTFTTVDFDRGDVEIEIPSSDAQATNRVRVLRKPLRAATGGFDGWIIIFQDITKVRSMEDQLALQERLARLLSSQESSAPSRNPRSANFVGESPIMKQIFRLIDRAAKSDATVLINGESGTGKELVAKALHQSGARSDGPFVPVNCGAIPENLIESELFGHKKGAFTGADTDSIGLFRRAHKGTIFLDEIGELPVAMQVKLLRALQERTVRPVGANTDIPIDVRVIAATNKNLRTEVAASRFREDLYYRLNVINIQLPPLRERPEDIPLLVSASLRRLVQSDKIPMVPPATMSLLMAYTYPGNVRELENILERAVVLGGEVLLPEHLPEQVRFPQKPEAEKRETKIIVADDLEFPVHLDEILALIERRYIEGALHQTKGAKKKAAELLGINFRSFRYRLQKFSIDDGESGSASAE